VTASHGRETARFDIDKIIIGPKYAAAAAAGRSVFFRAVFFVSIARRTGRENTRAAGYRPAESSTTRPFVYTVVSQRRAYFSRLFYERVRNYVFSDDVNYNGNTKSNPPPRGQGGGAKKFVLGM